MSSQDDRGLRLASMEPARSEVHSSVQVSETSSNRAHRTTSVPGKGTPEPLSLAGLSPQVPAATPSLRTRASMEDDLRGLDLRAVPHGLKRRRDELSDEGDSDDEPTPKRDKMLEELVDLQAVDSGQADNVVDDYDGQETTEQEDGVPEQLDHVPQLAEKRDLPLRSLPKSEDVVSSGGRKPSSGPQSKPESSLSGCRTGGTT